ncbi:hypothetical protein [uncultured Salinicola sp.]|uniref:hypothetical protein n=1 Tax=uncultured Salinicola sp. TaxID=1193542 RepID=UPI002603B349|nr:hypothetical protein [uncultured Salinicola sp.]|tara:strand:+ start:4504 stop:4962 length:459 start_codon:yes stop_codon:yes gene_type:complete
MNMHAGSLDQFLLMSRMQREIERQKDLPPRWKRPMIFRSPEQAADFVGRCIARETMHGEPWNRAKAILACTYGYYSWPQQAEEVMRRIAGMDADEASDEVTHGGMRIEIRRIHDETEIVFHVAEEVHPYRFLDYEGACVPVQWEVGPDDDPS